MEVSMTLHSLDQVRAQRARHHIVLKNSGVEEMSLRSFASSRTAYPDKTITAEISWKLACFAAALMMNGLIFAGVNYLLNGNIRRDTAWISLAYANGMSSRPTRDDDRR
jgi:hypothetical protein